MTSRHSETATPDTDQSAAAQADKIDPAAADTARTCRKNAASWGNTRNNDYNENQWIELIEYLPDNAQLLWRAVDDLRLFWRLLHAFGGQSIRVPRTLPKDKAHTAQNPWGNLSAQAYGGFWRYKHICAALCRTCEPPAPARHHQGFFAPHPARLKQHGCGCESGAPSRHIRPQGVADSEKRKFRSPTRPSYSQTG